MIECLCLVCHRPITSAWDRVTNSPQALFCQDRDGACRFNWYRMGTGKGLPQKASFSQDLVAYRIHQEVVLSKMVASFPLLARRIEDELRLMVTPVLLAEACEVAA